MIEEAERFIECLRELEDLAEILTPASEDEDIEIYSQVGDALDSVWGAISQERWFRDYVKRSRVSGVEETLRALGVAV